MTDIRTFSNAGAVHKTDATARHIAQKAAEHARAGVLTPAEQIQISGEATAAAYRSALATGKPLPDSNTVQQIRHAALNKAIDAKLAGAT